MPLFKRVSDWGRQLLNKITEAAKKVSFPFFDGVPIYNVGVFFWRSIVDGALTTRASAIAFNFFVALFPAVIFIFTLIPYIPIENFQENLFSLIESLVPEGIFETIEGTVIDIIMQPRGTLLSIGFLMALIFSTNGIAAMMTAFDSTIHNIQTRSWISQRITSIFLLFVLSSMLAVAIALIAFGQKALRYLVDNFDWFDSFFFYVLTFGKWVIIIALFFFAFSVLYYFAPAKKSRWRFISAGGTLSTILSIITIFGFSFYINNFNQYNKLYGSIGTLLIVLFLIYIISLILLIGFELNVSIYQAKQETTQPESLFHRVKNQIHGQKETKDIISNE